MDNQIMEILLKLLLTIMSIALTTYILPWIQSKMESTKYNDLLSFVKQCVVAANQLYTPEEWAEKKQYVLEITENYCTRHSIPITSVELNAIIEGFVKIAKGE